MFQSQDNYISKNIAKIAFAMAIVTAMPLGASAQDSENQAFEIAATSDRSDRGFKSSSVDLTMVLTNKNGKTAQRELSLTTFELIDETVGDKTLVEFTSPRDIDGTALLSHAKILDADDQWLYLPSIKRVKRISSANKSGPFVGSEFSFEDMTGQELNKYSYQYVGNEACEQFTCSVIERKPLYDNSAYSKQIVRIDQSVNQFRSIDYYDRKGDLIKSLFYRDYKEYQDDLWRAHTLVMQNHQTGKMTELLFGDYQFNINLAESDFSKGRLSRLN